MTPSLWLPRTKLYLPQVGDDILPRPGLTQTLHTAVLTHRLTLLSAPAGSGKTTAVAALHQAYPNLPLAWMTLDEDDNDPLTFLSLLVAALQTILPDCGQDLAAILASPNVTNFAPRRLMGMLMNDILTANVADFVLVLDDLHRVETAVVHQSLDYLLEHLPPALHLIITTRSDPPLALSRLRARGQLAEFRMEQLRFHPDEIRTLFNELLQFNLSADDLALLQNRTEGWVAGVRLLTLSLPSTATTDERTQAIHQIAHSRRFLFDYLMDEVLQQLAETERDFLLQTSILAELTPALCTAVIQQHNSAQTLQNLYRRNLFLILNESDEQEPFAEPTYRYHALFAQFLQRHLHQSYAHLIPELHKRAAAAQPDPARAIGHYVQAEAWPEARALIVQEGRKLLLAGLIRPSILRWIEQLPPEWQQNEPWFHLFIGHNFVQKGLTEQATPAIETASTLFQARGDQEGILLTQLTHPLIYGGWADPVRVEALLDEIKAFPHLLNNHRHTASLLSLAWTYQYRLQWDKVDEQLHEVLTILQQSPSEEVYQAFALATGPQFYFGAKGMAPWAAVAQQILGHYGKGDGLPQMGAYLQQCAIGFYEARLDEAMANAQRGDHIITMMGGLAWLELIVDHVRLFVWLARGEYGRLHNYRQQRQPEIEINQSYAESLSSYLYVYGLASWYQGNYAEVRALMPQMEATKAGWDAGQPRVVSMMTAWLAVTDGRYDEAATVLKNILPLHSKTRHTLLCSHPRLNLAYVYWAWYRATEDKVQLAQALHELDVFLAEVAARGMPGMGLQSGRAVIPLLQYAQETSQHSDWIEQILAAFGEEGRMRPLAIPHSNETLTPREVEVLHLLQSGASNKEIAAQLTITPRTAKAHVSNIMHKLQVRSRTEVVAKVHALGLL